MNNTRSLTILLMALVLVTLMVSFSLAGEKIDINDLMERAVNAYSQVSDYTCLFDRTELVGDRIVVEKNTVFRFQKPKSIYLGIREGKNKGVVSVYIEGENDDRMIVRPKGVLGILRPKLDPDGKRAMENSRHSIRDAGIGHVLNLVENNYNIWKSTGLGTITYLGEEVLSGNRVHAVKTVFPEGNGYYGQFIDIHFDVRTYLPVWIRVLDWEDRVIEEYEYRDIKLNPGLTDKDFEAKRP